MEMSKLVKKCAKLEESSIKNFSQFTAVNEDASDTLTFDIPLFIRMLEFAKEDAKTDMDLHRVTENALKLAGNGRVLSMADYDKIIG